MFTAVVLICLSGGIKDIDSCYTAFSTVMTETQSECYEQIAEGIAAEAFTVYTGENEVWEPVDFICVNWNGKRV